MRTMEWTRKKEEISTPERQWNYALLVEDIEVDGFHCESYGILACDPDPVRKPRCGISPSTAPRPWLC